MIDRLIDRPMPSPAVLVVTNGLEDALDLRLLQAGAGIADRELDADSRALAGRDDQTLRPSTVDIASHALTSRLRTTCWSWMLSPDTEGSRGGQSSVIAMPRRSTSCGRGSPSP
jgi:hypothetical protein